MLNLLIIGSFILLLETRLSVCQDDDTDHKEYLGKYLGKFDTFSHQIDGDLYAINLTSFLLKNFFYDGSGKDAYFWVGSSNHADRRTGYPIPDEEKKTNVLKRYINSELTLTLPEKKLISDLRWFTIYDVNSAITFAEVVFPEDFEPPGPHLLPEFTRNAHGVKSDPILALDSKTLRLTNFNYDGLGPDTFFLIGSDPIPSSKGMKIPDENGYLEPLRPYQEANVTLLLPGNTTIFDVDWLSIFNIATRENFGSLLFPRELNVPPSLTKAVEFESDFINCEQLHESLQLSWQFDNQYTTISFEMTGKIGDNDYMAFGINNVTSNMIGSHVIVVYAKGAKAFAEHFFITAKSSCLAIPKASTTEASGVCPARFYGMKELTIQVHKVKKIDGIVNINFTISLQRDSVFNPTNLRKNVNLIWAMGHLNYKSEPLYHNLRNTGNLQLNFDRQPPAKHCFLFTKTEKERKTPWGPLFISNPHSNVFNVTLGPAGGTRGYEGITGFPTSGLVWYINGILAPDLYVKRNQRYIFSIEGGEDIKNPVFHHPFYITNDEIGGFETLNSEERKNVNFYAGVSIDHKGRAIPIAAGRLCLWENQNVNPRNWDEYKNFHSFRQTLKKRCDNGNPYLLEWTPNGTIPDVVYYQSFRQRHMGSRIHIVEIVRESSSPRNISSNFLTLIILLLINFI